MSETTPDPADVHTGTDRVELTEAERAEIDCGCGGFADGAIERVIGARLASLIAARDRLRVQLEQVDAKGGIADLFGERDMWRKTAERYEAELAAANARCAELEALVEGMHREVDRIGAENLRHLATLDRVTAVADWIGETKSDRWQPMVEQFLTRIERDLRAALTPEGTP